MKILVNCYACSPYKGSEPGMGWNFVKCLSRLHELHIITESKFQSDIEKFFVENPEERKYYHFYFIEKERHKALRKIWPPSYYWFYKAWQKKAYQLALKLDEHEHFDIIHQLNMVGYREPGFLFQIPNKPFVWGPIGGFNITPWNMLPSMGLYGASFYGGRNLMNLLQMHTMQRVRKAMQRADVVISATQDCQIAIEKLYHRKSTIIPEVGLVSLTNESCVNQRLKKTPLRICWSGQHTPGKSLNLLIDALALIKNCNVELHVIGKGSQTQKWKRRAFNKGVQNIVWHDWVPRNEALSIMKSAHCFIITSMCDLTSTVILEALSLGLPVIAMDHCGFSNVLTDDCGIKIPVTNAHQIAEDLSKAIVRLEADEECRVSLSKGALERAQVFGWEEKAKQIDLIYHQITKK